MKNLFLQFALFILFLCCTTQNINAQYVTIPDPNFVTWLNANGYSSCMNGNMMDTTCSAVLNAAIVDCSNGNISDLTGIEYFDSLQFLFCAFNLLTSLPSLQSSLTFIRCDYNLFTSLPALPNSVEHLTCGYNLFQA
ncbi:MAG: hypothetical protein IPP29_02255 [Bacteroidetes bacterium]|nr:hypothetical protein [Bacteroidota bacterium]